MNAFQQLLLPTDFSEGSAQAAAYALKIAGPFDMKIHVLHILEPIVIPPYPGEWLPESFLAEREKHAQQEMEEWASVSQLPESKIVSAIQHGNPFMEIMRYAREQQIDLIVMGTHGRTGLPHAIIGSVAERVVRSSHCPVLTVRPDVQQIEEA